MKDDQHPLFIFEMANNHMGDVKHGLRIIRELHTTTKSTDVKRAIKFQYRQLETFIHPDYRGRDDIKYVKRFNETRLSMDDFLVMKAEAERFDFLTICTGFDEESIDLIEQQSFDYIKIASCSLTDWPLLERIAKSSLPVIASIGGSPLEDVDRVVNFLEHRSRDFCLMHCVAEYPTPDELLQLGQIDLLKARYPDVPIGFSTHERPDLLDAVKIAIAKGAKFLERHVGVPTERYALNDYSSTPKEIAAWVKAGLSALQMCGTSDKRARITEMEQKALNGLRRGIFVRDGVKAGDVVKHNKVFFAIPTGIKQYTANDFSKYAEFVATQDIPPAGSVNSYNTTLNNSHDAVLNIVQQLREFIKLSKVPLPGKADFELSHHYGLKKFYETGAIQLSFVNRSYCKKAIVLLPGQHHPEHWHDIKEETFFMLFGSMRICLDGEIKDLNTGDSVLVEPGVKHWFSTEIGVIFEEISSTHKAHDSFYSDPIIMANKNRKTMVTYWID